MPLHTPLSAILHLYVVRLYMPPASLGTCPPTFLIPRRLILQRKPQLNLQPFFWRWPPASVLARCVGTVQYCRRHQREIVVVLT